MTASRKTEPATRALCSKLPSFREAPVPRSAVWTERSESFKLQAWTLECFDHLSAFHILHFVSSLFTRCIGILTETQTCCDTSGAHCMSELGGSAFAQAKALQTERADYNVRRW